MPRRLIPLIVLSLVVVAAARAETRVLWPGVTYESGLQFTPNGPVAIRILTGPRPGGTTTLVPVLSNDTIIDAETMTAMQRRLTPSVTAAGVNGDRKTLATGVPTGVVMRDGEVLSPPSDSRSSAGVTSDGTLDIRRISFIGTWQGSRARRTLKTFNRPLEGSGFALYTRAWGAATPVTSRAVVTTAVTLFPFPGAFPDSDLVAPVVEVRTGGRPVPIPLGGAVLVATGSAAGTLAAEAQLGQLVTSRLLFKPEWPGVVAAVGGGPQIVRDGAPIFRAGELFTSRDLGARAPRTAVGQKADGRIILVTVDGRQPGYSVGMTNFELAQTLVRLGAVTGMSLDGGGSTEMAFDGTVLNRPSDGAERRISTALMFQYTGVFVPATIAVVSPDGDGVDEGPNLRYKLVRTSTVTITLKRPDGVVGYAETMTKQPGSYSVTFPPTASSAASTLNLRSTADNAALEGRWTATVSATDDIGQSSEMTRRFVVNSTVGFLATSPAKLFVPSAGSDVLIGWRQAKNAAVVVTVETPSGDLVRTLVRGRYAKGSQRVTWNGLDRVGSRVRGGRYVIRVVARNALGAVELTRILRVRWKAGS